jgi:hypothetical protein
MSNYGRGARHIQKAMMVAFCFGPVPVRALQAQQLTFTGSDAQGRMRTADMTVAVR